MIRHLLLRNFKCFDELSLTLGDLTLITGANGAGKSTIIQSLLLLRQTNDDKVVDLHQQVKLNGDLIELNDADSMRYALSDSTDVCIELTDEQRKKLAVTVKNAVTTEKVVQCTIEGDLDEALRSWSLFGKDFVYLYADRTAPSALYARGIESGTDSRLGDKHGSRAAFRFYESMRMNEEVAVKELCLLKHNPTVFANVSAWIGEIMGNPVSISATPVSPDQISLSFSRELPGYVMELSPLNVALGNSYIFPIVLAVLTAPAGSLLLIENPEAHLHPAAQFRMGRFLAEASRNGIQIVVETHSDHLLNGIRVAAKETNLTDGCSVEIHYIYQDADNPELHYDERIVLEADGSLDHWPAGFFDEWELALRAING